MGSNAGSTAASLSSADAVSLGQLALICSGTGPVGTLPAGPPGLERGPRHPPLTPRVNRACHLLMETDRLVTHVCYGVGFNNVANFNRRFLEIKGMTPSEFRRQSDHRFRHA